MVCLALALAVASGETASNDEVDNPVNGELTEQELDRENDDEPLLEEEDDDGEDMLFGYVDDSYSWC